MNQGCTRRAALSMLSVAGVGLLAGCSNVVSSVTGPPPDLVVFNRTEDSLTATITVRKQANGNSILSKKPSIDPDAAAEFPDGLPSSGELALKIETHEGLSGENKWSVTSEDQSMQVRINSNSIDFNTVSP